MMLAVEAAGDTVNGSLMNWPAASQTLSGMALLNSTSRSETLGLFYNASRWENSYTSSGAFTAGRPYLLARFNQKSVEGSMTDALWVMVVHLPHFLDTTVSPGAVIAQALKDASAATGSDPQNVIIAGDFNEFQWEDNPCPQPIYPTDCRAQAKHRMAPLWESYFAGKATDVVANHTVTCCTKWSTADRFSTNYTEWRFEYDHVFVAGQLKVPSTPALLPYKYPGTASPCSTPACIGEGPPGNETAQHQGSWHRGWLVDIAF